MASGRGWIRQQHIDQLHRQIAERVTKPVPPFPLSSKQAQQQMSFPTVNSAKAVPLKNGYARKLYASKKSQCSQSSYIDKIPSEIVLKIFSYLDTVSLLCVGSVNKRFHELSKDNLLWYQICSTLPPMKNSRWKPKHMDKVAEILNTSSLQEKPPGYWKKTFINEILANRSNKITQILKSVKHSMGIPNNIEKVVKMSGLHWALTFKDTSGRVKIIKQMDVFFRHTSLTLFWGCLLWPSLESVTTLQLHGITPVLLDKWMPQTKNGPQRLSLIAEYNLSNFRSSRIIGQDAMVDVLLLYPGLLLGVWKTTSEIAFVMATLHYDQILEISTLGSADRPYIIPPHVPVLDDIDPNYGLHGYQLHIDMHSGPRTYLCGTFRNLFCLRDYIRNGFLRLSAISMKNNRQHAPLVGKVGLMWKTPTFEGSIQNCFMMDVTVLDEAEKPFWCFSSPVSLHPSKNSESLYDFMGQSFTLKYEDSEGKVKTELVWMKETEEYYIINLVLYLSTKKVNSWFGTNY
ncbi:F-box only protein 15 [Spea bombifrons]|uniref:F-box only protein 15 n=1 Tax=Spea bombifrons TaxID=233779 RepID=UPI00234BD259|nr:F-box only protein 15 [Spea bombifrons]